MEIVLLDGFRRISNALVGMRQVSTSTESVAGSTLAAMANVGSIARIALPEVFKRIALNELSGVLEVSSGRVVRTVYFDRGFVVFTASTSSSDRLGQCLIEAGKLTAEELDQAVRLMRGKLRIGQAIVEAGHLTQDELGRELARQARRIAASLFALEEGMYRFEEGNCPVPLEMRLSLSIYRIQLEGIRRMRNGKLIGAALPPLGTKTRLSRFPPFSFEDVRFLPIELLVMEAAQKERAIKDIVTRVQKPRGPVLRTVYGLLSAGILELVEASESKPLKVQEETGTFLLSTLGNTGASVAAQNVRQEVLLEFEDSERASATELLHVDDAASEEAIEKAYERRRAELERKQKQLENEKSLCLKVEEIQRRLATAKARLLEDEQEEAPAPPPPQAPPSAMPGGDDAKAEVKRLLREIKLRRMVHDTEGEISFLYELVQINPGSAKFETMLAQALASHPVMKNKAERHFRRALSFDPQNAKIHYLLGRYYQSFGMKSRALAELKAALQIDPAFSKARAAVVELKGGAEGSLQDRLKQLFG